MLESGGHEGRSAAVPPPSVRAALRHPRAPGPAGRPRTPTNGPRSAPSVAPARVPLRTWRRLCGPGNAPAQAADSGTVAAERARPASRSPHGPDIRPAKAQRPRRRHLAPRIDRTPTAPPWDVPSRRPFASRPSLRPEHRPGNAPQHVRTDPRLEPSEGATRRLSIGSGDRSTVPPDSGKPSRRKRPACQRFRPMSADLVRRVRNRWPSALPSPQRFDSRPPISRRKRPCKPWRPCPVPVQNAPRTPGLGFRARAVILPWAMSRSLLPVRIGRAARPAASPRPRRRPPPRCTPRAEAGRRIAGRSVSCTRCAFPCRRGPVLRSRSAA